MGGIVVTSALRKAERRLAEIEGRVKGLKRVGKATEAAAQAGEAKVLRQAIAHAADAALDANRAQVRLVRPAGTGRKPLARGSSPRAGPSCFAARTIPRSPLSPAWLRSTS